MLDPLSIRIAQDEQHVIDSYERRKRQVLPNRYSWANLGNLLMQQERELAILSILSRKDLDISNCRILEVGCGNGFWLREFIRYGAQPEQLVGIDLLPERVVQARRLCPEGVSVLQGNASSMAFPDESFDIVVQSTVFSSVRDAVVRRQIASEMLRVTRSGGLILWYDFFVNNPKNADVVGIGRREIEGLFPSCSVSLQRITLLPPLARRLGPISPSLVRMLAALKWFSTHYLGAIGKQ